MNMPIGTDLAQMRSEMVRTVHDWWTAARPAGGLPNRRDFDPAAVKALLPHLIIVDVEPDPFRIRYRLVGTRVVDFTGFEFTGRYLDEFIPSEVSQYWTECYRSAYRSRTPFFGAVTEPTTSGNTFTFEFGIFPLTLGGDQIEQFIAVEDYFGFELTSTLLKPWAS